MQGKATSGEKEIWENQVATLIEFKLARTAPSVEARQEPLKGFRRDWRSSRGLHLSIRYRSDFLISFRYFNEKDLRE